jgi:hypothetical protein
MDWPEFLEFHTEVGNAEILIRVARETAEDDLGIDSIDGSQFRHWKEENYGRLVRSAVHKGLQKPFRAPGEDPAIILAPGDLID